MSNKPFFRNTLPSDLEAIAAIGTGAVLEPLAGIAGILGTVLPGQPGQGADWVRKVQSLAYQPSNPETLQQIGSALQYPMDLYTQGTDFLGNKTYDATNNATLATIAKSSPEILGGIFGLKQLLKRGAINPQVSDLPTDIGRRDFLKKAGGLMGAAAVANAIPGKSLMSLIPPSKGVGTKAAVVSAIKAVPMASKMSSITAANFLKTYPALKESFRKGGWKAVEADLPKVKPEGTNYFSDNFDASKLDNKEILDLIDQDSYILAPESRIKARKESEASGFPLDDLDFQANYLNQGKLDSPLTDIRAHDEFINEWLANSYREMLDPEEVLKTALNKLKADPKTHPSRILYLENKLKNKDKLYKDIYSRDLQDLENYGDGYEF